MRMRGQRRNYREYPSCTPSLSSRHPSGGTCWTHPTPQHDNTALPCEPGFVARVVMSLPFDQATRKSSVIIALTVGVVASGCTPTLTRDGLAHEARGLRPLVSHLEKQNAAHLCRGEKCASTRCRLRCRRQGIPLRHVHCRNAA